MLPQRALFRTSRSCLIFRPRIRSAKIIAPLDEVGIVPNTSVVLWLVNTLIVDDDPLVGLTLRHFVEKAGGGTACTHVTDGAAARRALAGGGFDVVFLDLELSELDGRSVLKALPPGLPVIVVSSHTDFAAGSYLTPMPNARWAKAVSPLPIIPFAPSFQAISRIPSP